MILVLLSQELLLRLLKAHRQLNSFLILCLSISAVIGSDCSSPVSAKACDNLEGAICDTSTNECECSTGRANVGGACLPVCSAGFTFSVDGCQPGKTVIVKNKTI